MVATHYKAKTLKIRILPEARPSWVAPSMEKTSSPTRSPDPRPRHAGRNLLWTLKMILRVLPTRQRAALELLNTVLLGVVSRVEHHDALVIEVLARGRDGLTADADALDVLAAAAAVSHSVLVVQAELVFGHIWFLDNDLGSKSGGRERIFVENLDVLVVVGALMLVLHA